MVRQTRDNARFSLVGKLSDSAARAVAIDRDDPVVNTTDKTPVAAPLEPVDPTPSAATAPTLTGLAASLTFGENLVNATPQIIDSSVVFTGGSNGFNTGQLTVTGLLTEDRIAIFNQGTSAGQIGVSGSNVTFGGTTIGTFTGGSGTGFTVTFNGSATAAAVDALIQNLTYANVSNTPTAQRTLTLNVTDSGGVSLSGVASFGASSAFPATGLPSLQVSHADFVDLDGDGDLDALVSGYNQTMAAYRNGTNGTSGNFSSMTNPIPISTNYGIVTAFIDVDGDGVKDAVVGESGPIQLRVFKRTGNSFSELTGGANPLGFFQEDPITLGDNASPMAIDVDGDGFLDLIVGTSNGTLRYIHNNGNNTFSERTGSNNPFNGIILGVSGSRWAVPAAADIDGDGDFDIVVGSGTSLSTFRNNGDSTFTQLTNAANPFNGVTTALRASPSFVDWFGDGNADLVVGDGSTSPFRFFSNTGTHGRQIVINVTAEAEPNTAPTLDTTKSPLLTTILEDAVAPVGAVGTPVSSLVDFATPAGQVDNVTDPDAGALLGIAVTGATIVTGTWYYSTNNGANWTAIGGVSPTSALLLAADANTRVYFQPNPDYNGTEFLAFRAWDQTSGTAGTKVDTSTNGGASAFSSVIDTAALTITAVNDARRST